MKKITTLLALFLSTLFGFSQTAKVQFIHNSGDFLLEYFDIYQDDQLLIDSLQYRHSTPFINVPANTDVVFTVQSPSIPDTTSGLYSEVVNLDADSSYVLVASGLISSAFYDSLKPFNLVEHPVRTEAANSGEVDVLFYHGVPDAAELTIDETAAPMLALVDSLPYGQFSNYLQLPEADYVFKVFNAREDDWIATYSAPFSTENFGDSSMVIVASGFIDTLKSNPGDTTPTSVPKFALFAAFPSGGPLYKLPVLSDLSIVAQQSINYSIYPNPATNVFFIQTETGSAIERVAVLDMGGKAIQFTKPKSTGAGLYKISMEALPPGLYLLKITDVTGAVSVEQIAIRR